MMNNWQFGMILMCIGLSSDSKWWNLFVFIIGFIFYVDGLL